MGLDGDSSGAGISEAKPRANRGKAFDRYAVTSYCLTHGTEARDCMTPKLKADSI